MHHSSMLGLLRVEEGVMMTSELQQSAAQRPVNTQSVHLCIDTIYSTILNDRDNIGQSSEDK